MIDRDTIVQALVRKLQPHAAVNAMWEGGAASFNRVDEWSDIDLQIDVRDDAVDEIAALVDQTLSELSSIEIRYELPRPTWHGHWQTFYQLANSSPYHMIDLVIIQNSNPQKFLEPLVHGYAKVLFDKSNVVNNPPTDINNMVAQIRSRLESLRSTFPLFQVLVLKEVHRKNYIEAIAFYNSFTLRPLLEVIRILFSPEHYNFFTRYIHYEAPPEIVDRLIPLYFIPNPNLIEERRAQAEELFYEILSQIDMDQVRQKISAPTINSQ